MDTAKLTRIVGIGTFHALLIVVLLRGTSSADWLVFAAIYPFAAIGVGVGMHRYFSHRAFETSRPFQFFLALCASLAFGNAPFFSGKHKLHHRHSDTARDVHTPLQGWWQCWIGSLVDCGYTRQEIENEIGEYLQYPELRFLYRYPFLPASSLCAILCFQGGLGMMVIGGLLSGILLLHQSSAVNYFCHSRGNRSFTTKDNSTNNALIALLSWGEGWHNNHHRFPRSARAGFHWWQLDPYYWAICLFEYLGLVRGVIRPTSSRLAAAASA